MVIVVAALSSLLRATVRAGSVLAVGTVVLTGLSGSSSVPPSGGSSLASAPDAVRVEQIARSEPRPDTQSAEVIATVAAPAPSLAPAAPTIPVPTTPASAPVVVAEPAPLCPADWFCYARVGIAGPILPYSDCSGRTDIGREIVSFTCLSSRSSTYLLGHAYTRFGNITGWVAGDIVHVRGVRYTVTGAITDHSCAAPSLPLAPLSMQTSLGPGACGPVLVVQAR